LQYFSKKKLILPDGFFVESVEIPSAKSINQLLASCSSDFFSNEKLLIAIQKSNFFFTILSQPKNKIHAFVRVTSDKGLNANLWNLCAEPGKNQNLFYLVLLRLVLEKINREMPGCSISVQAPPSSFESLKESGFILDPNGIRVMGYKI
tara:strand:+ start:37342 stop:37788 length:447 start_codon:yes stop_codon:yes gene_type:complete